MIQIFLENLLNNRLNILFLESKGFVTAAKITLQCTVISAVGVNGFVDNAKLCIE